MHTLFPGPTIALRLRPGRRHRVLNGHPWVFSNQVVEIPGELKPGSPIELFTDDGSFVGRGYGHPGTLISARLLSRREDEVLDAAWLADRLEAALGRRASMGRSAYRWVHSEADGLPGLVLDRYGDGVVGATNTAGMEPLQPLLTELLQGRFGLSKGIWKNDGRGRELEGLPLQVSPGWGEAEGSWMIDDDGITVQFDPWEGQKTGLFLDMWENRRRMAPLLGRGRVVDLYSYVGQWGLQIARAGAEEVTCVDRSAGAVALVEANAAHSGLPLRGVKAAVDAFLRDLPDGSLDAVVCDPPAFIRSKKQVSGGLKAYRTLFAHALRKVRPGGRAVLASCSHHLWDDRFEAVVTEAARWAKCELRLLARGGQSPCHPTALAVPETRYLKCWLVEVER
ncbi:MAG: class I SAM-dependent rRNA methyltransferase [Myxococcota bacterium]|nr:class I SAM-dependent rRNA methyltransferase [Myxococcota bacterium]